MTRWPLQPLLDLRRREEAAATCALDRALARSRVSREEAAALRREAEAVTRRALRDGAGAALPPADGEARRIGGVPARPPTQAVALATAARGAARLRMEATRRSEQAALVEARARGEAAAVAASRAALRQVALRREVVERLEATWRRERALEAARRAEAALDDQAGVAWAAGVPGAVTACRPAGSRPAPARTGR